MNRKISLILILVLAFVLRFYKLNTYPAFNADEAAIGYNAYSLIETGKDEHGNPWPIHFQSFNDYKPGLYVYMVMPFVKLLGLNEWAVRLPNAFLGVATVYVLYLLVVKLFYKTKDSKLITKNQHLGLIAALFLAISPWHLHFSRGGWEVNTATFFMVLGVLFYLKAVNSKQFAYLFISSLVFVLSLYTYHAARIVTPFIIIGLLGIYYEEVIKNLKIYVLCAITAIVLLLPLAKDLLKPAISSRAAGVGLFADSGPLNRINEERGEHAKYNSLSSKLLHNKGVNYSLAFLENWSAHYHGLFLFLSGDDVERDKVPETGQMYMIDALFVIIGLSWMVKNWNKEVRVVIHWLLIAPLAAALTFQSPHALRSENMIIPLVIISSIGFCYLLIVIKKFVINKYFQYTIFFLLSTFIVLSFFRYLHMYYVHMSKEYPFSSQYGVKELVNYVNENEGKFNNVVVTDRYDQPYILFMFYLNTPPGDFQNNHELTGRDKYGFSTVSKYGKYVFKSVDWESDKLEYPNSLIAGTGPEIPREANIVKKIYGTNDFEYFDIAAN